MRSSVCAGVPDKLRRISSESRETIMERIPVIEIFGPTIQGEGMVIGQKRCLSARQAATIVAVGAIRRLRGTVRRKMK